MVCSTHPQTVPWWTSQRFLLAIICFFGFVVLYAQRVNLSIAIVSMVIHDNLDHLAQGNATALTGNNTGLHYSSNVTGGSISVVYNTTTPAAVEDLCPEIDQATKTVSSDGALWGNSYLVTDWISASCRLHGVS